MAELPIIQPSTVAAIYQAWEAAHKDWDSVGISMGDAASECDRYLWLSFRWASEPEKKSAKTLGRFKTGNIYEQRIIELCRQASIDVVDLDPETGRQFKLYSLGGHCRGKLDGFAHNVPEAPKARHILEIKATNDKSWKEIVKKGVQLAKPAHWMQCQKYMHRTGVERTLYIVANTNTDELHSERIRYDALAAITNEARLERIIKSNSAPSRIQEDQSKWPCIFCRQKEVCAKTTFGRNNCRTCIHSTPVIDESSDAARWHCERFGKDLSVDEQRAGCPAHLYLPDVVPGKQIDAGEDFVSYTLNDGQTWRDGVPAGRRYFWNSASLQLFATDDGTLPGNLDGPIEELDAFEYAAAARWLAEQPK